MKLRLSLWWESECSGYNIKHKMCYSSGQSCAMITVAYFSYFNPELGVSKQAKLLLE